MIKHDSNLELSTINDYFFTLISKRIINCKEEKGFPPTISIDNEEVRISYGGLARFEINSLEHQVFVREALKTLDSRLYFKSIIDALTIDNATDNNKNDLH